MCGIGGVFDYGYKAQPQVTPELLTRMSDAIVHRGPDDAGFYIAPTGLCGLTFRRLAIVDLSPAGHQPMSTPDGRYTLVFNGEIYNHLSIRAELEAKGYKYKSRSDTETILYAYQEWGEACLEKFHGMFAIAIWDENEQELFLARDRIGIKPLYYATPSGRFIFASEIKAMLQHPSLRARLNENALPHYLSLMMPPAPDTMFKGVHKLEAGHAMRVKSDGTITKREWWSLLDAGAPLEEISEEEAIEEIRRLLRQSIKDRMMSDVPFGVFLSGGIDSSLNVALMAELMDRPVQTFSVGFKELEKYNEMKYARSIAERYGTDHHEVLIDSRDAEGVMASLAYHEDEPNGDPVCIPLYFVSKLARESGTIVVQVGEGSDEEFAGYPWLVRDIKLYDRLWRPLGKVSPKIMRRAAVLATSPLVKNPLVREYMRRFSRGEELFWGGALAFTEEHKRQLLQNYSSAMSSNAFANTWHKEVRAAYPKSEYTRRMMYLEFKQRLPELLLMRVDKVSMATSLEARVPFLDHRMVEFAFRLPRRIKLGPNYVPKYILKKAAEGILPKEHIYRKKMGFAAPVNEWLKSELRTFTEDRLFQSELLKTHMNMEYVRRLFTEHTTGARNNGQLLWSLLNLVLWEEQYLR
ncbi:MAG: asparagine synthase (glutamine-hydrolyzing) [Bacteroidota bacterium]|nr:asparagine synthase (glutamine-hydrolyzing) [Bacteroidota bacterium]MDP4234521.1 asparagine synthase (glutamine-hydrolyzing) [Bacteroidota bacterium]MDP4242586.1 asparagine synthase (glutamine-hydrolyzing) [Bacteroidota bacterium]MDP4289390.1 asparagine synthase (glutamine-hydrolyzing) [Bacteroidota bacterium]